MVQQVTVPTEEQHDNYDEYYGPWTEVSCPECEHEDYKYISGISISGNCLIEGQVTATCKRCGNVFKIEITIPEDKKEKLETKTWED